MKNKIKIKKWSEKEIETMVRNQELTPYIKPTTRIHDSGYRCFEVGYCKADERVNEKMVLGISTDHVWFNNLFEGTKCLHGRGSGKFCLNIDLTRDGYIRFFRRFKWTDNDRVFSTAELTFLNQKGVL